MKKYILMMLLVTAGLYAADVDNNAGKYGFQFAKIPVGTISAAQAGNGFGDETNAFRFFTYPTATASGVRNTISAGYSTWLDDTALTNAATQIKDGKMTYGFGLRYLDYGEIEGRDEQANIIGVEQPYDLQAAVNMAYRLSPNHYVGITGQVLYEKIATSSAVGFYANLGYTYKTPLKNLILHTVIRNLGTATKMDEEKMDVAKVYAVALAYEYAFSSLKFNPEASFETMSDEDFVSNLSLATHYQNFNLMFGYKLNHDVQDFSAGFGFALKKIGVNYAFLNMNDDFDAKHVFSVSYLF